MYYSQVHQHLLYFGGLLQLWMDEFGQYLSYTEHSSGPNESPNDIDKFQTDILAILDFFAVQDEELFKDYY
jgi:hypothetical protein